MTSGVSTGPRTPEGKAASSMNALKHGLTAKTALIPGEDPEEFRDFVWSMVQDLAPRGPVQAELAQRVAVLMWKRRRLAGAEEQALADLQARYAAKSARRLRELEEQAETEEDFEELERENAEEEANGERWDANQMLADQFGTKPGALDRLARYEQRLSQQIDSTIRLLVKLQNRQDWQAQQGSKAREELKAQATALAQGQPPRESTEPAGAAAASPQAEPLPGGEAAPAGGAVLGFAPRPPAPAQNELPLATASASENEPRGAWRGPPGAN